MFIDPLQFINFHILTETAHIII